MLSNLLCWNLDPLAFFVWLRRICESVVTDSLRILYLSTHLLRAPLRTLFPPNFVILHYPRPPCEFIPSVLPLKRLCSCYPFVFYAANNVAVVLQFASSHEDLPAKLYNKRLFLFGTAPESPSPDVMSFQCDHDLAPLPAMLCE